MTVKRVQVLIFAERTGDVDNILENLITSGVEAVAVHGGLDQQDREYAIQSFKVYDSCLQRLDFLWDGVLCSLNYKWRIQFQDKHNLRAKIVLSAYAGWPESGIPAVC